MTAQPLITEGEFSRPTEPVCLSRELFDALRASAKSYNGIGWGLYWEDPEHPGEPPTPLESGLLVRVPCCGIGHAFSISNEAMDQVIQAGMSVSRNDAAVKRSLRRKGIPQGQWRTQRVTFDEWCAEAVVRCDE